MTRRRVFLILIAVLEILSGVAGLIFVAGAVFGPIPKNIVPMLWYGFFPGALLIAGLSLLLDVKGGFVLSVLVQLLQVPLIITPWTTLNLSAAMQLRFNIYWPSTSDEPGTVLGINFLAVGALIVLWWYRPAPTSGIEQIVGRERRERVSHDDWSGDA
jgi:hypothetical protein